MRIAHVVRDKTVRTYKRTDFRDIRRKLMDGWADYVNGQSKVLRLAFVG